ncbi:MAG: T9SS C-terminal target domain-containing protein [Saprospirales bacterium]|nr:MAG: T9SS C-terminal target domain-containing protein [Saprospirales bacterium]
MRISVEDLGLTTSIVDYSSQNRRDLKAFPNPTSGPLTLEIPDGFTKGTLEIVDIRAGTVHRKKLSHLQEQFSLDIGHLPAGVYHIELYTEENQERVFYGARVVLSF